MPHARLRLRGVLESCLPLCSELHLAAAIYRVVQARTSHSTRLPKPSRRLPSPSAAASASSRAEQRGPSRTVELHAARHAELPAGVSQPGSGAACSVAQNAEQAGPQPEVLVARGLSSGPAWNNPIA